MKLATYDVNGRLAVLLRWLKQSQPDVVCLQELKALEEKFPDATNTVSFAFRRQWPKQMLEAARR
jgi:exonuclease III